ncbi:MAG: AAA family ATPase [Coriobacteriales bacterium]|jgi:predicted ATPase
MGALGEKELYVRGIYVKDDLPEDNYVHELYVVRELVKSGELTFSSPVTIFVGENGVGKSTLIEAIAVALGFNAEGGTRNFNFSTMASHSILSEHLCVQKGHRLIHDGFFLRAESFYNVASNIEELDKGAGGARVIDSYGGTSLHEQSHGESFMALARNRFGGKGLYILDEPEAALSPRRVMELMATMKRLVDDESQFLISTHSPMIMMFPGADVVQIGHGGIRHVDYRETDHFQIMARFLADPDRMLSYLFGE